MRLLVSVRDVRDARAAVRGGADIVDAKDPRRGALGPVTPSTLARIRAAVPPGIPVSAALGDAEAEREVTRAARLAAARGAAGDGRGAGSASTSTLPLGVSGTSSTSITSEGSM